ncbi:MAG: sulfatase-like hydrolase/transferase [Bryobacteraceae bacterium]|nr:sulfatase-like hydrolase/transferase [Bryobacteraceae bacterium]
MISRRSVLAAPALLPALSLAQQKRWNILWLSCEDTSPDLGCYGDQWARTPNLDRLASEGARFTRAFSTYGVCAPSRSSIITGMYPSSIGTHHMRSHGVPPPHVKCFTEYLRAAGYYCTNNVKTDYNFDAPLTAWDENSNRAHYRNRTRKDQPFFSVFNLTTTHESQVRLSPEEFAERTKRLRPEDRHRPEGAKLPPYYPDTPVVRKDWANYYDLVTTMDLQMGDLLRELNEQGLADNTVVFFWGDHGRGLPRAKRWVYDSGIHVPLIVRWPGMLKPGTVVDRMVSLMDLGPTALSIAGHKPPAYMQGQAFLGPHEAPARRYVFAARDRMDETYDLIRAVRDPRFKYIRNYQACKPYAQYIDYMDQMPTMREWRRLHKEAKLVGPQSLFFAPEKPPEELYDTAADPHEINNLAARPEHKADLERLRAIHEEWTKETKDLGHLKEDDLKERMRPGGVWQVTAQPSLTPNGGTFSQALSVRLQCGTPGASIAYTFESGANARWLLYSGPVSVERSRSLRVKACRLGYKDSPEVRAEFQVG